MKTYLKDILNSLPDILKYAMVLATVVLISFLFPEDLRFKFDFKNNQIWKYEDFYAPFDFSVQKNTDEIERQKAKIRQEQIPFYTKNKYKLDGILSKLSLQNIQLDTNAVVSKKEYDEFIHIINQNYIAGIADKTDTFSSELIKLVDKNKISTVLRSKISTRSNLVSSLERDYGHFGFNYNLIIEPNVLYDSTMTHVELENKLSSLSTTKGKINKDELIVRNGQILDDEIFQALSTLKENYEQNISKGSKYWNVWIGYFVITLLCIVIFILYLRRNSKEIFSNFAHFSFLLFWLLSFSYLVYYLERTEVISIYVLPFCVVPIVIRNFLGERVAFITFLFVVVIASFLSTHGYEFTIIELLAGLVAIISDFNTKSWMSFFRSLALIALVYMLSYFTLDLIETGDISQVNFKGAGWLVISAFLNLLAYPLIPLFERIFGFTSNVRLSELADLENPILKNLAIVAPGTFQHSLQVANLAEAAAKRIHANSTLLRTAALYHDIGKTQRPQFYVENAEGVNYHESLSPAESAEIIIQHVTEGAKMAKKKGLPSIIIDFILSHHGTTRVEYFYRQALDLASDEDKVDARNFTYPGPLPRSKEEVILMIADSLEAASKSIKEPTWEALQRLLDGIVEGKIKNGQLQQSELSFKELNIIKESFLHTLKSIYHGRIKYPDAKS